MMYPQSIQKAGADDETTVIAVTSDDEVNLIACQIAKRQFNVNKTICRLSEKSYTKDLGVFGENVIDIVINPEKEATALFGPGVKPKDNEIPINKNSSGCIKKLSYWKTIFRLL